MNEIDFRHLLVRHFPALCASALYLTKNSVTAKDLLQDTLVKALNNSDKFAPGTNIEAWLQIILRNTFYNHTRKLRVVRKALDSAEELPLEQLTFCAHRNEGIGVVIQKDIYAAMQDLPAAVAQAFSMFVNGYKYHEIANASRAPIGTVKTRIHMARKLLRQNLAEYGPDFTTQLVS